MPKRNLAATPSRKTPAHTLNGEYVPGHLAINRSTGVTMRCACVRTVDHWATMAGTWEDTHPTLF